MKYKEVRKFTKGTTVVMFYFVTRCYGDYIKSVIDTFDTAPPDIVIMNSCLWDLCRYGKDSISEFKKNIKELLEAFGLVMPFESKKMLIWNASLPVIDSRKTSWVSFGLPHGFHPENDNVRSANLYVRDQMVDYGNHFVFLDLYNIFHGHLNHRVHDGVHWDDFAHRKITHFLLSEISERLGFKLPCQENTPPVISNDPRKTIRPSLPSIPSVGGRRSLGFVPNHSTSPYQRPSPRPAHQVQHSPYRATNPLPLPLLATMVRLSNMGTRLDRPGLQFPFASRNPLTSQFSPRPRPYNFERSPYHWRTSSLNNYNGPPSRPVMNFFNCSFPSVVGKRKFEEESYPASISEYKRPRKFL